jgi:hypothetical protein
MNGGRGSEHTSLAHLTLIIVVVLSVLHFRLHAFHSPSVERLKEMGE